MSKGLKNTFLAHAVVSLVFGLGMYFAPGLMVSVTGWTPYDPGMTQAFGGMMLALALSSWLGYQARSFNQVRILVQMELALTLLLAISSVFQVALAGGPAFNWVSAAIYLVFAFLWFTYRKG